VTFRGLWFSPRACLRFRLPLSVQVDPGVRHFRGVPLVSDSLAGSVYRLWPVDGSGSSVYGFMVPGLAVPISGGSWFPITVATLTQVRSVL
jgi:hypothetical protein